MKRFIQSSIENLSIEVGSIAEVRCSQKRVTYDCSGVDYQGYMVEITTIYGKTITVGVYDDITVANNVTNAIKATCVKEMLEPIESKYKLRVDISTSTVRLPQSSKKEKINTGSGLVDFSKLSADDFK